MTRERVKKCLRRVIDAVEADLELLDLLDQAISGWPANGTSLP